MAKFGKKSFHKKVQKSVNRALNRNGYKTVIVSRGGIRW